MADYALEEYVQWQIPCVTNIHVNIVLLARLAGFLISAAVLAGTIFFNQDVSVLTYVELWGTGFAMLYFFYGFSLCGHYRKVRHENMSFAKVTTLRLAEHIGFITVSAGVTALLFWFCYEAAQLDKYGFSDPSLGGGDEQQPTEAEAEDNSAPDGEGDCANCVFGYDLGPWQETVSLGNHLYVPLLVVGDFLLGRIPVQWKCFISLIVAMGAYIGGVYYYTTEHNNNVGPYPGFNFQFGDDGDTTQDQILIIAGSMAGVGVVQFILRNFILGRIVPEDKKDKKDKKEKKNKDGSRRRGEGGVRSQGKGSKGKSKGGRWDHHTDYDDAYYAEYADYRAYPPQGGKAKGKGKGKGKGKSYNSAYNGSQGKGQQDRYQNDLDYDSDDSCAYGEIV